jgi:hypothetical protein
MTPYGVGAAYNATWDNSGDFVAREGFQWDETRTYDQYGTISADFAFAYTRTVPATSFYTGVYGWSNDPLVEFYIVDYWSGAPAWAGLTPKGSAVIDGATYDFYKVPHVSQPSIHGPANFPTYYSVRKTNRQCGHISITQHFGTWASLGMTLGNMNQVTLLVEAIGGSGSVDFSAANMTAQ